MARVVALYRYPVKGFTPEACEVLTVLPEGRVAGDRALGFRFADSQASDAAWSRKHEFVALVNTPGIARTQLRYDHEAQRLRIDLGGVILASAMIDAGGRKRLADAVADFVLTLDENPLSAHPERLPLRLIGNGATPRYQDSEAGQITLHSRESLAAVATAAADPALDELRFRSNIVIEGVNAWQENEWVGGRIRVGKLLFDVVRHKTRCLATHANPRTGERDLALMTTLVSAFGQILPTFAVAIMTSGPGGDIHVGDVVEPIP
jgi:MOSC domain-containing protein